MTQKSANLCNKLRRRGEKKKSDMTKNWISGPCLADRRKFATLVCAKIKNYKHGVIFIAKLLEN
jgi:hypothetical protein